MSKSSEGQCHNAVHVCEKVLT